VFLNFSGYNPPPNYRRLNGDFYYLHLRTLETVDFHITANAKGFYINNSNLNYFDPDPHPSHKGIYSNFLNLLKYISPKFKKVFEESVNNNSIS
jgi:protein TIF31